MINSQTSNIIVTCVHIYICVFMCGYCCCCCCCCICCNLRNSENTFDIQYTATARINLSQQCSSAWIFASAFGVKLCGCCHACANTCLSLCMWVCELLNRLQVDWVATYHPWHGLSSVFNSTSLLFLFSLRPQSSAEPARATFSHLLSYCRIKKKKLCFINSHPPSA